MSEQPSARIAELLAAAVRGTSVDVAALRDVQPDVFCAEAEAHGLLSLVAGRLCALAPTPVALKTLLLARAQEAAVRDMLQEAEIRRAIDALDRAGLTAVIVKGAHLAYLHYQHPQDRPRVDTDIMIPADARSATDDVLSGIGYARSSKVSGELVTGQSFYVKRVEGRPVHGLDVHWKLASPLVFARFLSYDELAATSVPLPRLGQAARGPSNVNALLIACVHRVAHHADALRLVWLYDIDLLARSLTAADWQEFVDRAIERKVAAVSSRGLEQAAHWFHTPLPGTAMESLRRADVDGGELTARYLEPRAEAVALVDDLRVLESWRERVRLVREHVLPPADYMRKIYAPDSVLPLGVLYVWRVVRGAGKWLSPGGR